jgi:hypothetical protein
MFNIIDAAHGGKVPILVIYQCTSTDTADYAERQERLEQIRELERAAATLDERRSWHHAVREIERAIARAITPTTRARCASPVARTRVGRAGARRAPRAPRRAAAARAAPPGDPDPDPASSTGQEDSHVL